MVSQNELEFCSNFFYWLTISNFLYIIILLILAAISIGALVGDDGLFNKTKQAKERHQEAVQYENEQLKDYADKIELLAGSGRIGDYIDLGNNVIGTSATTDDWRIFYEEGDRIYAILAGYLPNNTTYINAAGFNKYDTYTVYVNTGLGPGVTKAAILDKLLNESIWNGLANGIEGATVTGSPTVEQLKKSYEKRCAPNTITLTGSQSAGYSLVFCTADGEGHMGNGDDLYTPVPDSENLIGYWLASPGVDRTYDQFELFVSAGDGAIGGTLIDVWVKGYGCRPVVSLPASLNLTKVNNVWTIQE